MTYLEGAVKPTKPQALQIPELFMYELFVWKVRTPTLQKQGYVKFIAQSTL